jgi:predicted RNase H-like HicB family nuclease
MPDVVGSLARRLLFAHAGCGTFTSRPRGLARYHRCMKSFTAVIERDDATGLFVGYVPGWPGAHSQGATLDELRQNLEEVIAMLLEDGDPKLEGEFVGTQTVKVA